MIVRFVCAVAQKKILQEIFPMAVRERLDAFGSGGDDHGNPGDGFCFSGDHH